MTDVGPTVMPTGCIRKPDVPGLRAFDVTMPRGREAIIGHVGSGQPGWPGARCPEPAFCPWPQLVPAHCAGGGLVLNLLS
ncbi:hypothetical protein KTQ54_13020 [Komagataeibacter oboediens]|uniref:hypothetical protein n=1 Tax=Komagataeibacter oboediens TaxID=65958 RepID=UPI001C2B9AD1|nr:hypothetical protein [Komagataeibacter oboediens]MBV0889450.1 hypothetical protein [Komagataeibacter oboediens]MCK9818987.1 hypothetical protein [Komagataeibacter oboediens]